MFRLYKEEQIETSLPTKSLAETLNGLQLVNKLEESSSESTIISHVYSDGLPLTRRVSQGCLWQERNCNPLVRPGQFTCVGWITDPHART